MIRIHNRYTLSSNKEDSLLLKRRPMHRIVYALIAIALLIWFLFDYLQNTEQAFPVLGLLLFCLSIGYAGYDSRFIFSKTETAIEKSLFTVCFSRQIISNTQIQGLRLSSISYNYGAKIQKWLRPASLNFLYLELKDQTNTFQNNSRESEVDYEHGKTNTSGNRILIEDSSDIAELQALAEPVARYLKIDLY